MDITCKNHERISQNTQIDIICVSADDYACFMQVLEDFDAGSRNCDGCRVACMYDIIFNQLPSSAQVI